VGGLRGRQCRRAVRDDRRRSGPVEPRRSRARRRGRLPHVRKLRRPAVEDLENENIDVVVIDLPVAETFAANRDVEIAFIEETGEQFGFGLRQGESEFQSALNDGLATVRDDGTYSEITNTWFGQE